VNALLPSTELATRFARDLASLVGEGERVGLAVSGGADSMAMLLLGAAAMPGRIEAATVDHGLRRESVIEALHVEDICQRLGVAHTILSVEVPGGGEGLQGEARRARYRALGEWAGRRGLGAVATAHHAEDQAETLLMRLRRGAGVGGLAGVRPRRMEGAVAIVRPLLGWSRAELAALVAATGIEPVDDPANRDLRFDRTEARRLLAREPWLEPRALARSAGAIREAEEALAWTAELLWQERATSGAVVEVDSTGLPAELRRRLVLRALREVGGSEARGEEVARLLGALERGEVATLAGVKCSGGTRWRFEPAPQRRKG
jgi:tRNA(Ile)-lysidine synthase